MCPFALVPHREPKISQSTIPFCRIWTDVIGFSFWSHVEVSTRNLGTIVVHDFGTNRMKLNTISFYRRRRVRGVRPERFRDFCSDGGCRRSPGLHRPISGLRQRLQRHGQIDVCQRSGRLSRRVQRRAGGRYRQQSILPILEERRLDHHHVPQIAESA